MEQTMRAIDQRVMQTVIVLTAALAVGSGAIAPAMAQGPSAQNPAEMICMSDDNALTRIKICNKLLESQPERRDLIGGRGIAYAIIGKYDLAISDLDKAIEAYSEHPFFFFHFWRGEAYRAKGEYDRAVADFDAELNHPPSVKVDAMFGQVYRGRALAHSSKGDKERAKADFEEAQKFGIFDPPPEDMLRLADEGDALVQLYVAGMYLFGYGVPRDYSEAVKWFRKAAEQGNVDALNNLGVAYRDGQGVPQDYAEAVKWFLKAAQKGSQIAPASLGALYANGQGVPRDFAEAVKWFRVGAELGNAWAQYDLGVAHYEGKGVRQDYAKSVAWFRRAAEQGFAEAQNNLGHMYKDGLGVRKDLSEAAKWIGRAAEQGNPFSQSALGLLYEKGQGVPRNNILALKWLTIAASAGHKESVLYVGELSKRMNPGEIAEAQKLANAWKPTPEQTQ